MDFFDERVLAVLKTANPEVSLDFWAKWASAITLCNIISTGWWLGASSSRRRWLQTVWEGPNSPTAFHPQQQSR